MKSRCFPYLRTMTDFAPPCTQVYTAIQLCNATHDPPGGYHAIHIIVENGNVTLTGVVDSDMDLALAGMRANSVPGVLSVDNDLQVAARA